MNGREMAAFWRRGEPMVWIAGTALAVCLLMIGGLILLVAWRGLGMFWPQRLVQVELRDGAVLLGEERARERQPGAGADAWRTQFKIGNRDLFGLDFRWVDEREIVARSWPADAVAIQRLEYGDLFGVLTEVRLDDRVLAAGPQPSWRALQPLLEEAEGRRGEMSELQERIGRLNNALERERLAQRRAGLRSGREPAGAPDPAGPDGRRAALEAEYAQAHEALERAQIEAARARVIVEIADGRRKDLPAASVLRVRFPNRMGTGGRLIAYVAGLWEFLSSQPRESNTEGGVLPALFGTVLMVLVMTLAVVPFGVLAALYLREYARQGILVRAVRIAVNNLAGVPSIVFGVFGLAFFIYTVGGAIDRAFYAERLPAPTFGTGGILWASLTLALLTVPVVIVAAEEALAAVPREYREGSLALGATRWQTIRRVILPAAAPGILTGMILAMARGAGEVAPLMITGVVKLAPDLPLDGEFPFLHLERKFMHLGFHIYDVGFQSPNVEASKPMVYATAFLMLALVLALNLTAILLRNRLRRRLAGRS
jgi:phosphate transport system permease protein